MIPLELIDRVLSKVKVVDGCWVFTGSKRENGYGRVVKIRQKKARAYSAHRIVFEYARGPVPDGLQLDHLCRNRACVNPAHLEAVTARENTLRGESLAAQNARKTHCKRGHEFTPANILVKRGGGRRCRICYYAANRADKQRKKATA